MDEIGLYQFSQDVAILSLLECVGHTETIIRCKAIFGWGSRYAKRHVSDIQKTCRLAKGSIIRKIDDTFYLETADQIKTITSEFLKMASESWSEEIKNKINILNSMG